MHGTGAEGEATTRSAGTACISEAGTTSGSLRCLAVSISLVLGSSSRVLTNCSSGKRLLRKDESELGSAFLVRGADPFSKFIGVSDARLACSFLGSEQGSGEGRILCVFLELDELSLELGDGRIFMKTGRVPEVGVEMTRRGRDGAA